MAVVRTGAVGRCGRFFIVASVTLWAVIIGIGLSSMVRYEMIAGPSATTVPRWPADSSLLHRADRPTLVMAVHPRCPCSRASLQELRELVSRNPRGARVYVLFYTPKHAGVDWTRADSWENAELIPGAVVIRDEEGIEAQRFGARTSGQVLLYDNGGRLAFSGGITAARGHAGSNEGTDSVESILSGKIPARSTFPVYGCPLFSDVACGKCEESDQ